MTTKKIKKTAQLPTTHEQVDYFKNLLKTDHRNLAMSIIRQAAAGKTGNSSIGDLLQHVLNQLSELNPQNYIESMLIAQMIQANNAAGNCMNKAFSDGQSLQVMELHANLAIKFQRTFVAQIEALQKLRGNGGQKVTVEHVHVHEGGQAIVGNVNHAPGGGGKNEN